MVGDGFMPFPKALTQSETQPVHAEFELGSPGSFPLTISVLLDILFIKWFLVGFMACQSYLMMKSFQFNTSFKFLITQPLRSGRIWHKVNF